MDCRIATRQCTPRLFIDLRLYSVVAIVWRPPTSPQGASTFALKSLDPTERNPPSGGFSPPLLLGVPGPMDGLGRSGILLFRRRVVAIQAWTMTSLRPDGAARRNSATVRHRGMPIKPRAGSGRRLVAMTKSPARGGAEYALWEELVPTRHARSYPSQKPF